nr:Sjogrens syndrome scleroderma autoantigen 1 domain containing protein [Haemonchus contortus]
MAPVNGIRELSEEQLAEAQEIRAKFRDDVSKKMGELLLRGVTMLDAYCHICDGILMEDRNGVRRCVTCELLEEHTKEGSRLVAEVPLGKKLHRHYLNSNGIGLITYILGLCNFDFKKNFSSE